ncbi:BadF/BadG/BcrA/BcrD ATPase family protein [Paenibacillus lutrae]|uniref:ATPase n=1 Tax=Paenibacillus lutrae TaxID=2078573 RepID=A0A7X3JZ78_9BACL|nr:ATPase [Paenibacillus lutrae]
MNYYLGMDAGGTKTYAVIADESGNVVGTGRSGMGNHQINHAAAVHSINAAVEEALQQAGLTKPDITFAFFGLAGADRETDFRILREILQKVEFKNWDLACDTIVAMRAGTTRQSGVVVISGTGVNCSGMNERGEAYQCGGFSYDFGDFGGGSGLSIEAFRTVIRAWDGREEETLLTGLVLKQLGYGSVEDMFNDFLDHEKRIPNNLTKLLFEAASQGDAAALRILRRQGEELGLSIGAVIKRLGMSEAEFDVVLAGSVLMRGDGDYVEKYIEEAAKKAAPRSKIRRLEAEPVVGSVLLAMQRGGMTVSEEVSERLKQLKM